MKQQKRIIHRRGSILLYSLYFLLMFYVFVSLAVDYGHFQIIKTEEQRCADNTARGILQACLSKHAAYGFATTSAMLMASPGNGMTMTQYVGSMIYSKNPVDAASGVSPTIVCTLGSWYSNAWHNDGGATGPLAVQVMVSRTVQTGNPFTLAFPLPSNHGLVSRKCDVWAKAVALLPNPVTILSGGTVSSTGDPWLAGLTTGYASYDDTAPSQSPTALTVIPGSTLTFANVTGKVKHLPDANVATDGDGPNGSSPYWHMKDPPGAGPDGLGVVQEGQGMENGISDLSAPIDSMIGVFLDSAAPNATSNTGFANPPHRDSDTDIAANGVPDLVIQQPFYIGDGKQANDTTIQTFIVPGNATRFYLGIMDGYEWNNNVGSFSVGTLSEQPPIQIVQ